MNLRFGLAGIGLLAAASIVAPTHAEARWQMHEYVASCLINEKVRSSGCGSDILVFNLESGDIYNCHGNNGDPSKPAAYCNKITSPVSGPIDLLGPTTGYAGPQQKLIDQFQPSSGDYFTRNISYFWVVESASPSLKLHFCGLQPGSRTPNCFEPTIAP